MKQLLGISIFVLFAFLNVGAQNYKLVWEDNFDGSTLDSTKWNYETKIGVWNTGANQEFQHYKQENVAVGDDGNGNNCLIITAKKEDYNGKNYTSGKVTTKGKFAFKQGKLEAMIKMPDLANGLWPAFWTLGYTPLGWPDCGEIDILEMGHAQGISDGVQNSYIGAHLFWGPFPRDYGTEFVASEDLSTGYFKHTLIWDESKISVYFNDAASPYFTMGITGDDTEEYRDFQHYVILNMAVGGSVPGIFDAAGITANMPANMYVDWVRVYQEEGKEDYNANSTPFGVYGVYEDVQSTDMSMNLGYDLYAETLGLTEKSGEAAFEGDNLLAYDVAAGADYELSLGAGLNRNMSNYKEGSIQLMMKTTIADDVQIGIGDDTGVKKLVTFSDANGNNFERDGSWQSVYVEIADLTDGLSLEKLKHMLIIKGTSTNAGYIAIDQVMFKETVPAGGYYGIACDNSNITEGFVVDNAIYNMYIWDGTVVFNDYYPAFEGENVLSWKATGTQSWFGFGFHSSNPLNFSAYENGYLNVSVRTKSTNAFYIGMDGDDGDAVIDFAAGSDPYGFERNGEWNHLHIPLADLTAKGLNLASIKHVFKSGGGGAIGNIAYDNIYLSEGESDIDNPLECYANSISVSPESKTITIGESATFKASVLNQFGNKHDDNAAWSASAGTIDEDGVFVSDATGEFTVTANQDQTSGTATVTVTEATGAEDRTGLIKAYMNNQNNTIEVYKINEPGTVIVYDVAGRVVFSKANIIGDISIPMHNQSNGIYILKVQSGKTKLITKVSKQ